MVVCGGVQWFSINEDIRNGDCTTRMTAKMALKSGPRSNSSDSDYSEKTVRCRPISEVPLGDYP